MNILFILSLGLIFLGVFLLICFGCYEKGWSDGFDECSAIYKNSTDAAKETVDNELETMKKWEEAAKSWQNAAKHWETAYNLVKERNDT